MPFVKGHARVGGRQKGLASKIQSVRDRMAAVGFDPFDVLRLVALGELPCGVCFGKGKSKYQAGTSQKERKCLSCYGSGKERVSPAERSRAADSLAKYCEPQLKQIEVQGSGGGPVLHEVRVTFVKSQDGKPAN